MNAAMTRTQFGKQELLICMAVVVVAFFYAPGFAGFWLGDDVPNLNRVYLQSQQGNLWQEALRLFANPAPSDGAFYRPIMMLSLTLNYVIAGADYGGWYLINFLVHLANTLLVAFVVLRFAKRYACDATIAAPLAAVFFGLCPILAEGVYWVSARSDGWVALLSLAGLLFWSDARASNKPIFAIMLPISLALALGFKESAAVLPLQMALLAVGWPGPLGKFRCWTLASTFVVAGLFLAWRSYLFGNAWQVYLPGADESIAWDSKLWGALLSIGPWWESMSIAAPVFGAVYPYLCVLSIVVLLFVRPTPHWRVVLALACAGGGLALATMLNLGALSVNGEGGRLAYGPVTWLSLAIGLSAARPASSQNHLRGPSFVAYGSLLMTVVIGVYVLYGQLSTVWAAQGSMRKIAEAFPSWAKSHDGLTMLIVPDHNGSVVMARNAQGGLALQPIQSQPYLHQILPTLRSEVQVRQEQFSHGLASQLAILRPSLMDTKSIAAILTPSVAAWPEQVACWSRSQQRIIQLPALERNVTSDVWLATISKQIENCEN